LVSWLVCYLSTGVACCLYNADKTGGGDGGDGGDGSGVVVVVVVVVVVSGGGGGGGGGISSSEYMVMSRDQNAGQNKNLLIGYKSFESVEQFKCLETTLMNRNCTH
jgi:hypothetical protein